MTDKIRNLFKRARDLIQYITIGTISIRSSYVLSKYILFIKDGNLTSDEILDYIDCDEMRDYVEGMYDSPREDYTDGCCKCEIDPKNINGMTVYTECGNVEGYSEVMEWEEYNWLRRKKSVYNRPVNIKEIVENYVHPVNSVVILCLILWRILK